MVREGVGSIAEHNGRIVKTTGDGVLVEFASAVDGPQPATSCAVAAPHFEQMEAFAYVIERV